MTELQGFELLGRYIPADGQSSIKDGIPFLVLTGVRVPIGTPNFKKAQRKSLGFFAI